MQVYRGLPHPDQPVDARLGRVPRPRRGGLGRATTGACAHADGGRDPRRRPDADRRRRHRALPARGPRRARAAAATRAREPASDWRASTTSSGRRRRCKLLAGARSGRQRPPCTRTSRRRVVRALELAEAGSQSCARADRLWSGETRHPTLIVGLDVPADEPRRGASMQRTEAMFERGVEEEVRACARRARSRRPRARSTACADVAELPRDGRSRVATRTRRYAAYQRKWMRRIPRTRACLDGTPPAAPRSRRRSSPSLVAWPGEALEVAWPRQRLPARRAGCACRVPLTPERVQRLCDYHFGVGSDGILEVVSADSDTRRRS